MNERKVKQLLKLLDEWKTSKTAAGADTYVATERSVIGVVEQWVKWYGRDELSMDL